MNHLGTLLPKIKADDEYAISKGQYFYFKKNSSTLADIALYDAAVAVIPGDGANPPERVPMLLVSANTFTLLGLRPEQGRVFNTDVELSKDPAVALISDGYWRRRFGSDPAIVGKRLKLAD